MLMLISAQECTLVLQYFFGLHMYIYYIITVKQIIVNMYSLLICTHTAH